MVSFTKLVSLVAAITFASAFEHASPIFHNRRHNDIALKPRFDIEKRGFSGSHSGIRATYYAVGLNACGGHNTPDQYIVALSQKNFGFAYPSKYCGAQVTIKYGGKTAHATIVDSCVGCPEWGLDFSKGLFSYFASLDEGVLSVSWSFGSGDAPPPPKPKPTTKKHTTAHHTTTHHTTSKHHTTSTHSSHHTTSTHHSNSTKTSTTSSHSSTPTNPPKPVEPPTDPTNIIWLNQLVLNFGGLVEFAAKSS